MGYMLRTIFILLSLFVSVGTVLAAPIATVTKASGSVFCRSGAMAPYVKLSDGSTLDAGAWVKTGRDGWLELSLADKSRLTVANDTELELSSFSVSPKKRQGIFNLVQGKLRAAVVKLAGRQTDIKVRSATAVAGIKGTEFMMLARGPANVLFGTEGTVSVSGTEPGDQPLTTDTLVQTTRGYRPLPPVTVEPESPLADARAGFAAVTGASPPDEWRDAGVIEDIIARWNINYGHYLADSGKYEDALHAFQLALDLTEAGAVRADALLERGTVYGRFLGNPEAALAEYLLVLERYPDLPQSETALFSTGQIQYEMGLADQASIRFREYLQRYPTGRYHGSAETFLKTLEGT